MEDSEKLIIEQLEEIKDLLLSKNRRYGDAALSPLRVFSKEGPVEQLKVRIDDKISRIKTSSEGDQEDTLIDLIGYLVLLRIAKGRVSNLERW